METEQPEMEARPRTPGNPISVQGPETPLTGKTLKSNGKAAEHNILKNEFVPDQQLWSQENNLSLKEEEPEPLHIKEEQEARGLPQIHEEADERDLCTIQELLWFIQKQAADVVMVTSISGKNEHREPEPNSDQLLCLTSTENQDEEGSRHVDSGSAESEELKMKKRRLETGSHYEDTLHVLKKEEVLQIQQLSNQERNSNLDQEEQDSAQVKKEEEELCISLGQEHFGLKKETDTFMVTPTYVDNDSNDTGSNSDQLLSKSSAGTGRQNVGANRNVDPESTKYEEPKPKMRSRSHGKNVDNFPKSENQCNPDKGGKSAKCDINEKAFKNKSRMKKYHTVHISEKPYASEKKGLDSPDILIGSSQLHTYILLAN
ncbi:uncharacterized protein KZ484_000033 [Pholidichthys leucotaenia]